MPHHLKIARDFFIAVAGLGLAFGVHAQQSHSLRLMPRVSVGNADATVGAAALQGWEVLAGFSLAPARKTLTGAWIIDVPADISAAQVRNALHVLRSDPGILWVDDKAMPQRSDFPGYAQANRMTGQLVVRAKADAASRAMFAPGIAGNIARHMLEPSAVYGSAGYTVERMLPTGHALLRLDTPVSFMEATALAASLSKQPGVVYAEPVGRAVPLLVPNDPEYVKQWNLSYVVSGINAPAAWNVTTGAPVTVAVIDTGILSTSRSRGKDTARLRFHCRS